MEDQRLLKYIEYIRENNENISNKCIPCAYGKYEIYYQNIKLFDVDFYTSLYVEVINDLDGKIYDMNLFPEEKDIHIDEIVLRGKNITKFPYIKKCRKFFQRTELGVKIDDRIFHCHYELFGINRNFYSENKKILDLYQQITGCEFFV